jgi:hypothetical protein
MPVARLRLRITSHWVGSDSERAARSLSVATSSSSGRGFNMPSLRGHGRLRAWHKAAFLLSPALFTMGKHLLGLAGGILALGAVTAAAALPWAALAFTAARNSSEMGAAGARYAGGLARVESAWMKLARDTAGLTLGPVTDVLNGIAKAIPKLEPLVREVAPDFARMGKDIGAWLGGNGFDRFLQNIRDYGVPAFRQLVAAGKDFLATVGIGFRQFLPMARQISEEIRRMAAGGLGRAQGGGFANWMRDWRQNAPAANKVLRETATALNTFFTLLNDAGPGLLGGLDMFLGLLNKVDPKLLTALIVGYATGKLLVGLALMIAAWRALQALRAVGFARFGAALIAAAGALSAAGATLNLMAAAINRLAGMVAAMGRFKVNSSALDEIKKIWDSIPKSSTVRVSAPSLNLVVVGMMGIASTVATVRLNASRPATLFVRADVSLFMAGAAALMVIWGTVRILALLPPTFSAVAVTTAQFLMGVIITSWARVRLAASLIVLFTATASPGTVAGVANSIIASWTRVRTASASRPFFTAMGSSGPVTAGAAMIIAAWARVRAMPKLFRSIGIVSPGNVPGTSAAVRASWMRLYGMARSWHGVASCNFSGGFGGVTGGGAGGGGGDWKSVGIFVAFPPATFGPGRLPNLPSFPDPQLGGGNLGINPNDWVDGGSVAPPGNPGDFAGGFGGSTGGQLGKRGFETGKGSAPQFSRKPGERHVHIYEDIWIRNEQELAEVLADAMGG